METKFNTDLQEQELQEMASKKMLKLKSFYKSVFFYSIVLILYLLKEYTNLPLNFLPLSFLNDFFMILCTGVFVGTAIDAFISFKIFGEDWEQRKLRNILEKKTKKQKWE